MVSQKYRGSCIGAALAKWLAKNTVANQKMALEEKMEDGALEMLLNGLIFRLVKLVLFLLCNDSKLWTLKSSALQMRAELKGKIYFPIRNLHF